mgnify:CR=1 FL=1
MCILQNGPEQKLSKTTITTKKNNINQASEIPTTKKIRNIMTVLTIPPYIPDNKMKRYFLVSLIVPDVIYRFYLRI